MCLCILCVLIADQWRLVRPQRVARRSIGTLFGQILRGGKLKCLCKDPISTDIGGPPCRVTHGNVSVCTLTNGGQCARSWVTDPATGEVRVRDSCIPRLYSLHLCSHSNTGATVKCCGHRNRCQSDLRRPDFPDQSVEPGTQTISLTTPATSSSPPETGPPFTLPFDLNITHPSPGEKLRCLCTRNGKGCNSRSSWCETDGHCFSLVVSDLTLYHIPSSAGWLVLCYLIRIHLLLKSGDAKPNTFSPHNFGKKRIKVEILISSKSSQNVRTSKPQTAQSALTKTSFFFFFLICCSAYFNLSM